jgi:hypothetical protein
MSIMRPPQRLHLARVVIALAASVAVAGLIPAAAGARGPQGSSKGHHLEFRLSGRDHQDILREGAIVINARCPTEACTVVAQATSRTPAIHTATVHARVGAGKAASISLPLAKRQRGKLKAALRAGKSPTLTVKAIARDHAGNKIPLSFEVRAFKP